MTEMSLRPEGGFYPIQQLTVLPDMAIPLQ